jgi:hypothetical protein
VTAPAALRASPRRTALAAAVAAAAAAAALGLVLWAGPGRAPFGGRSFPEVEAAFGTAGLQVCSSAVRPDGLATRAVESRTYQLAVRCPEQPTAVVVDRFATDADRDAAARQFESLGRPRGSGVVWTLGDTTVLLHGTGDRDVRARLGAALDAAGAR